MSLSVVISLIALLYTAWKDCFQRWENEKKQCLDVINNCFEKTIKEKEHKQIIIYTSFIYALKNIKIISDNSLEQHIIDFSKTISDFIEETKNEDDLSGAYENLINEIYKTRPLFIKYLKNSFIIKYLKNWLMPFISSIKFNTSSFLPIFSRHLTFPKILFSLLGFNLIASSNKFKASS